MQTVTLIETEIDERVAQDEQASANCPHCGSRHIRAALVNSAFWHQDRLVAVQDIPALVCDACHEQFYDDATIVALDLLRGDGFPPEQAIGELRVPLFSLGNRAAAGSNS